MKDLSDAGESDEEWNEANDGDENFLTAAEQTRPFVHHGRYKALQSAKLWK